MSTEKPFRQNPPRQAPSDAAAPRAGLKKHLPAAAAVLGGWLAVYLAGRVFCTVGPVRGLTDWLFGREVGQLRYLYGWLLQEGLFWYAMAVSVLPALFGKRVFALVTLAGFAAGLLLGEVFGPNPAGAALGNDHYGWTVWGVVFVLSIAAGALLQKRAGAGARRTHPDGCCEPLIRGAADADRR